MRIPAGLLLVLAAPAACSSGDNPVDAKPETAPVDDAAQAQAAAPDGGVLDPAVFLTGLTDPRQSGPYAPRDDCGAIPGAEEFREKLAGAVLRRDADALAGLFSPDVLLDFGGGEGVDELVRRLEDPYYNLWQALYNLVPLGCAAGGQGDLLIPWHYGQDFPARDAFSLAFVRGEKVPLFAAPKAGATVAARLSWDAVDVMEWKPEPDAFVQVATEKGQTGYMRQSDLRSLVDYRLVINRGLDGDEDWLVRAFVAGD